MSTASVNIIVVTVIGVCVLLAVIHLIAVYRKSPCGDCANAKQCRAFSKRKILKAYRKSCEEEFQNSVDSQK